MTYFSSTIYHYRRRAVILNLNVTTQVYSSIIKKNVSKQKNTIFAPHNYKKMKVGITFSPFDHLHAGYIKMLEEAKKQCDYLIVGLQTNPKTDHNYKGLAPQTLVERYIQLNGCKYVDEIVPFFI